MSKLNFKNAGIETLKEAIQRLMNGEVFYYNNYKMYYTETYYSDLSGSPFACESPSGEKDVIKGLFTYYRSWKVSVEWFKNLPEQGILCWVSDTEACPSKDNSDLIGIVNVFNSRLSYPFRHCKSPDDPGFAFKYATPLSDNEIKEFLDVRC